LAGLREFAPGSASDRAQTEKVNQALISGLAAQERPRAKSGVGAEDVGAAYKTGIQGKDSQGRTTMTYANGSTWTQETDASGKAKVVNGQPVWKNLKTGETAMYSLDGRYKYMRQGENVLRDRTASEKASIESDIREGLVDRAARDLAMVKVASEAAAPVLRTAEVQAKQAYERVAPVVGRAGAAVTSAVSQFFESKPKGAAKPVGGPTPADAAAAARTLFSQPFSKWGAKERDNLGGVISAGRYDLATDADRKRLYDTLRAGGADQETAIRAAEAATNPHRWFDSNTSFEKGQIKTGWRWRRSPHWSSR